MRSAPTGAGRRAGVVATILLVAAALLVVAACAGGRSSTPTDVSLAALVAHQDRYDGHVVRTSGRVRGFTDPDGTRYYVVEDEASDRVLVEPARVLGRFSGTSVTVEGCFTAATYSGRTIVASQLVSETPGAAAVDLPGSGGCRPSQG